MPINLKWSLVKAAFQCEYCLLPYDYSGRACGGIELNAAPDQITEYHLFCRAACAHAYIAAHPSKVIFSIPKEKAIWDYGKGCFECKNKSHDFFAAVKAPYGSLLDTISEPTFFCSLTCLLNALARDVESMEKHAIEPWYLI